ncbi:MAG: hypothetical protein AAGI46_12000 [Planctomycetota bacterium]
MNARAPIRYALAAAVALVAVGGCDDDPQTAAMRELDTAVGGFVADDARSDAAGTLSRLAADSEGRVGMRALAAKVVGDVRLQEGLLLLDDGEVREGEDTPRGLARLDVDSALLIDILIARATNSSNTARRAQGLTEAADLLNSAASDFSSKADQIRGDAPWSPAIGDVDTGGPYPGTSSNPVDAINGFGVYTDMRQQLADANLDAVGTIEQQLAEVNAEIERVKQAAAASEEQRKAAMQRADASERMAREKAGDDALSDLRQATDALNEAGTASGETAKLEGELALLEAEAELLTARLAQLGSVADALAQQQTTIESSVEAQAGPATIASELMREASSPMVARDLEVDDVTASLAELFEQSDALREEAASAFAAASTSYADAASKASSAASGSRGDARPAGAAAGESLRAVAQIANLRNSDATRLNASLRKAEAIQALSLLRLRAAAERAEAMGVSTIATATNVMTQDAGNTFDTAVAEALQLYEESVTAAESVSGRQAELGEASLRNQSLATDGIASLVRLAAAAQQLGHRSSVDLPSMSEMQSRLSELMAQAENQNIRIFAYNASLAPTTDETQPAEEPGTETGDSVEQAVLGSWQVRGGASAFGTFTFEADGTATVVLVASRSGSADSLEIDGRWAIVGQDVVIEHTEQSNGEPIPEDERFTGLPFEFENGELILRNGNGDQLARVNE